MVVRLAPRMARPVEALADSAEDVQPREPVAVAEVNLLPAITTEGEVAQTSGGLDAEGRYMLKSCGMEYCSAGPDTRTLLAAMLRCGVLE